MNLALGRPWTPAEDAMLRARYEKGEAQAIATETGRTLTAVFRRAQRLGVATHRRWTKDDDRRLRNWWGDFTVESIAKRLNRSAATTFWRAKKLGLQLGAPRGREYLTDAAIRTGYAVKSLRLILNRSGVEVRPTMSRPTKGRRRRFHCVDPHDVDEAVAAWLKTEPLEAAARVRGVSAEVLVNRLRGVEGVPPRPTDKAHWRIPTELLDRAMGTPFVDRRRLRARGTRGRWATEERRAA